MYLNYKYKYSRFSKIREPLPLTTRLLEVAPDIFSSVGKTCSQDVAPLRFLASGSTIWRSTLEILKHAEIVFMHRTSNHNKQIYNIIQI